MNETVYIQGNELRTIREPQYALCSCLPIHPGESGLLYESTLPPNTHTYIYAHTHTRIYTYKYIYIRLYTCIIYIFT